MASEKFRNVAQTTLASSYTSGQTTLSVASAALFPTAGVFRVRLGNAGKTVWRVDSVAGTTLTGVDEENDANAGSGDSVRLVGSAKTAQRFLQAPESGEGRAIAGVDGVDFYGPLHKLTALDQSGWSWVNQGGASVNQGSGVVLLQGVTSASRNSRLRVKTAPSTPWTVTALVQIDVGYTNFSWAGIAVRESSSSKLIWLGYTANAFIVEVVRETNETTFSLSSANRQLAQSQPLWLRVTDNGTNLVWSYSLDGVNFQTLLTEGRTAFMAGGPNQVGILVGADDGVAPALSVLSWLEG